MRSRFAVAAHTWSHRLVCGAALMACGVAQALELNQATEAQLDGLRGLGPSRTARILQAREARPFLHWADFMARVKGIQPATAAKLSAQGLTIQGASYAPEPP
jgi:competence protein ComEA